MTEVVNYGMDGQPISWDEAMRLFEEDRDKRIVEQTMVGDIKVSTVLLVINHNFGDGPPLIFETMIFGGEHDQFQERYRTWEEAEAGHKRAVALARGE